MAVTDDVARYRDIAPLGVGGMATVTLAEDTMLRRRVALKRVHAGGDAQAISRLRREALVGASLSHPNLVSIYDVQIGEAGDLVIVMEYVAGQTLRDAIAGSGGLPPASALEVLDGVAAALDAIHARGIVHRDVKPANILLGRDGGVKLADLGIAVASDRTQITTPGTILGTFSYMAPEQLEGDSATPAADVYALAAVAFEMLSGQKARPQTNPVAVAHAIATRPPPDLCAVSPHAPPAAAAVLARGMAAAPANRPQSAGELVARLRAALEPSAETAPAPRPRRPPPPPAPRERVAAAPVRRAVPSAAPAGRERRDAAVAPPSPARREPGEAPPARRSVPSPAPPIREGGDRGLRTGSPRRQALLAGAGVGGLGLVALALALAGTGGQTPTSGRSASTQPRHAAAATATTAAGTASTAGSSPAVVSAPSPSSPAGAVQAFYGAAARHDYAAAWALADPAFRTQLQGFGSFAAGQSVVRQITFDRVATTPRGPSAATVAIQTTAVLTTGTEHCQGPVQVLRTPAGGWMLHQISISCVRA